ncbi:hypothetical protein BJF90_05715 [Pseudonocardia sp. CNS-004]|nr:hypothetical protein BJF90_05715 [Pseudonocardia sp. CNS-004]
MEQHRSDDSTIAVLGADETNLELLRGMPGHECQTFVPLLTDSEMQEGEVSIPDLLDRAAGELDGRAAPVDAVIDFTSPRGDVEWSMTCSRDGWNARTVTRTVLTCTATAFEVHGHLDAYEGEHRTFSRDWARTIPRDLL